jgi:hypothetical protein
MPEPQAAPPAPLVDDVPKYPRKRIPLGWYRDVGIGIGGLFVLLLGAVTHNPAAKTLGFLMEAVAAFAIIRIIRRRKWNATGRIVKAAEPYEELQASMARLHEAEDREHLP